MFALVFGLYHAPSYAQPTGPGAPGTTPSGGTPRPGDFQPELPQEPAPAAPIEVPEEAAPEAAPAEEEKVPYGLKIFVKEIRLTGNTVFTTEELQETIAPYTNRVVSSSELEDLRVALTRYYIDRGYLNSGAVLPDQKVVDGTVDMVIVEGRLTEIEIT